MAVFVNKYDKSPPVPLATFSDCGNEEEIMKKKTRKKSENEKVLKGKRLGRELNSIETETLSHRRIPVILAASPNRRGHLKVVLKTQACQASDPSEKSRKQVFLIRKFAVSSRNY